MIAKARSELQSVSNAIRVLEALDATHPEMGVTDLAKHLNLHKSIVFRLLKTLEAHGWIRQQPNRKYTLSLRAFEIGYRVVSRMGLGLEIQPLLEELAQRTAETVNVGVRDGKDIIYINKVTSAKVLRVEAQLGVRMPAHCTAMGKILLAYASRAERDEFIAGAERLPRATAKSIEDPQELNEVLDRVRAQGYAWSEGELFEEISCVAAPIRDFAGRVIAALSLAMQSHSCTGERRAYLEREVKKTADLISRRNGYRPDPFSQNTVPTAGAEPFVSRDSR